MWIREKYFEVGDIPYSRNTLISVQESNNMVKLFQENRLLNRNVMIKYLKVLKNTIQYLSSFITLYGLKKVGINLQLFDCSMSIKKIFVCFWS